jgi:hypothetical protein
MWISSTVTGAYGCGDFNATENNYFHINLILIFCFYFMMSLRLEAHDLEHSGNYVYHLVYSHIMFKGFPIILKINIVYLLKSINQLISSVETIFFPEWQEHF